jgi:hypothetical protein
MIEMKKAVVLYDSKGIKKGHQVLAELQALLKEGK